MKFATFALAATLAAAAPRIVQIEASDIKPRRIGGSKIKLPQVYNGNFKQHGKGPRARLKVYEKYERELPKDLVDVVQKILKEIGFELPAKKLPSPKPPRPHVIGSPYTNETDDQGTLVQVVGGFSRNALTPR
jgi:hypothetical protein